jgi:hypothetical protein
MITYCKSHNVDWRLFKEGIKQEELASFNTLEFNAVVKAAKRDKDGK